MRTMTMPIKSKHDIYVSRIAEAVDKEMAASDVFPEKLDRTEVIEHITQLMKRFTPDQFLTIDDEDFQQRVGKLMANQLVSGMLSDLSPDELRVFDEAVSRR